MQPDDLKILLEKYASDTATPEERAWIESWYLRQPPPGKPPVQEDLTADQQASLTALLATIHQPRRQRVWMQVAACTAGVLMLTAALLFHYRTPAADKPVLVQAPVQYENNRFILLPDSSRVVLHPGSTLSYTSSFNEHTREVTLTGEAYFNVVGEAGRPFLIHTGKVTTRVLGTTFTIRAYPQQPVTVSVTSGKVSVTDDRQQALAEIRQNEQLVYTPQNNNVVKAVTEATQQMLWVKNDLQFDGLPLGAIAEKLSRRYNKTIEFKNQALRDCRVYGRFNGTESLQEIMSTLTKTLGGSYSIADSSVVLDGPGCK